MEGRTIRVEGPFSMPLMLANVQRRPNEIVDLVIDQEYRRLLVHGEHLLLLRAGAAGPDLGELRMSVQGMGRASEASDIAFAEAALRRVFSLDASPQAFYDHVRNEPVLGTLSHALWGLRPLGSPTIFEMLVVAILGQQI